MSLKHLIIARKTLHRNRFPNLDWCRIITTHTNQMMVTSTWNLISLKQITNPISHTTPEAQMHPNTQKELARGTKRGFMVDFLPTEHLQSNPNPNVRSHPHSNNKSKQGKPCKSAQTDFPRTLPWLTQMRNGGGKAFTQHLTLLNVLSIMKSRIPLLGRVLIKSGLVVLLLGKKRRNTLRVSKSKTESIRSQDL